MLIILLVFNLLRYCTTELLPTAVNSSWTILPQFPDYMLIIHYDNSSLEELELFYDNSVRVTPRILMNYDFGTLINRPSGYKFMNLVFLKNWTHFELFSQRQRNLLYEDVIIFVNKTYKLDYRIEFYYAGIERAGGIFIYTTKVEAVYAARFYNEKSGILNPVLKIKGIFKLRRYVNDFKNFENFMLKVSFSNCEPFIYKNEQSKIIEGAEFQVLLIISEMLKFKIKMIDYSNSKFPRRSMIEAVRDKKTHIAIGCISNTQSRNSIVDFTSDVNMETHTAIYSSSGYQEGSFFKIVTPFETDVWIYLIVAVILMGLLIKKIEDFIVGFQEVDCFDYIKIPFRNIVEQSVTLTSKKTALRIIYITWFLVAIIITNSYKGKLASTLIKPITKEPNDLGELEGNNFNFLIPATDPSYLEETLQKSNDATFTAVLNKWTVGIPVCEALKKCLTGRYAVIDEVTSIKYLYWNKCPENLTNEELRSMRLMKTPIFDNSHVWAIQKTAPFGKRFTQALAMLQSTGLINKWYDSFNLTRSIRLSNQVYGYEEPPQKLDLQTVFAPYIILALGIVVSTVIFIIENVNYRKQYNGIEYRK